ncbi:MAG: restriction endonuclease subunit S, partial [Bacteroidales bacterium]|nr:restriction endonuclease subunit S [Bacteroidales bacterium]
RIVSILDEAFSAITKAKANAEQNLKNAKELFESYLQGVFEKKGEGWEEKKLGEVLVKTETTDPTKNPDTEFTYLDVSSVNKETKEIETPTVLIGKDAPSRAKKMIRTGDVIFATVRPTHSRVALIPEEFDEQVCSTGYFVLRTKQSVNNKLVFYFLLTNGFNEQMEKLQRGASYPAVTDNDVKSILFRFPTSKQDQQTIVHQLDALRAETKRLEAIYQKKIVALEELKKAVLQKAFRGELKMSELGFDGLKDDKITEKDKKKILQSSNPINHNSDDI